MLADRGLFWREMAEDTGGEAEANDDSIESKPSFVVRNTFIEGLPGTPGSPFQSRQAQSCPGTSLLPAATPIELPGSKLASLLPAVPSTPNSEAASERESPGLEGAARSEKPWGPDLVASLVSAAASAVEKHTPSLPSASVRSSPLLQPAWPSRQPSGDGDGLETLLAFASGEEAKAQPCAASPVAEAQQMYCSTPSPWQGVAVLNPIREKEHSDMEDPVAALVASAAAAATSQPRAPPPQVPPQYANAKGSSASDKGSALTRSANAPGRGLQLPLASRLPRIASEGFVDGFGDAGEDGNGYCSTSSAGARLQHPAAPDAQAMAESFASLVSPEGGGCSSAASPSQWWSPLEASSSSGAQVQQQQAEQIAFSPSGEQLLSGFVAKWSLDANSIAAIRTLPFHVQQEVFQSFLASPDTKNVNAKFISWLSSKMRNMTEIETCLETTQEERQAFYSRWKLDHKCQMLVEDQPAAVQRELISNFQPPAGTRNVDGKMTAFLNMILSKTRHRKDGRPPPPVPHAAGELSTNSSSSSSVPRPENARTEQLRKKVDDFVARWNLDSGARQSLLALPENLQQVAMDGFNPSQCTDSASRKFIAFLKTVRSPTSKQSGRGKGKGRGAAAAAVTVPPPAWPATKGSSMPAAPQGMAPFDWTMYPGAAMMQQAHMAIPWSNVPR